MCIVPLCASELVQNFVHRIELCCAELNCVVQLCRQIVSKVLFALRQCRLYYIRSVQEHTAAPFALWHCLLNLRLWIWKLSRLATEKADCMPPPIQLNAILRLHSSESHSCVLQNIYIITAAKLSTNFLSKLYISCSIFMCDPCIMYILYINAAANIIIMFHEAR